MRIDTEPSTIETSVTASSISVNPARTYTIAHDNEDAAHALDRSTIYLGFNAAAPDGTVGINKFKLLAGRAVDIGPGVEVVQYKSAGGAPTFAIAPGIRTQDR